MKSVLVATLMLTLSSCEQGHHEHGEHGAHPEATKKDLIPSPRPDVSPADVQDNAAYDAAMKPALDAYLKIQDTLAADKTDGVADAAKTIAATVKGLDPKPVKGAQSEVYRQLPKAAADVATGLAEAKDIKEARAIFKELSVIMSAWWKLSQPGGVDLYWCSMAPGGWLQKSGSIRNPYYGASMLECGEQVAP